MLGGDHTKLLPARNVAVQCGTEDVRTEIVNTVGVLCRTMKKEATKKYESFGYYRG